MSFPGSRKHGDHAATAFLRWETGFSYQGSSEKEWIPLVSPERMLAEAAYE